MDCCLSALDGEKKDSLQNLEEGRIPIGKDRDTPVAEISIQINFKQYSVI